MHLFFIVLSLLLNVSSVRAGTLYHLHSNLSLHSLNKQLSNKRIVLVTIRVSRTAVIMLTTILFASEKLEKCYYVTESLLFFDMQFLLTAIPKVYIITLRTKGTMTL